MTTWTWDTAPLGVSGKLALGALAEVESPEGTASRYSYDKLGRLDTIVRSIGDELFGTSFTYDELGRVATVSYPEAVGLVPFTVKNEYDAHGHLTKVWNPANGSRGDVFYWQLTDTDSADRITAESLRQRLHDQARVLRRGEPAQEHSHHQGCRARSGPRLWV